MKRLFIVLMLLLITESAFAVPALKLPVVGEKWRCDQGNATDPQNRKTLLAAKIEFDNYGGNCSSIYLSYTQKNICTKYDTYLSCSDKQKTDSSVNCDTLANEIVETNITHYEGNNGNLAYAWDFNWGFKNQDLGKPVLAPADGDIVYVSNNHRYNGGWGNTVIIDYKDGSYGKLSHLKDVFVLVGQKVKQGEVVGTIGKTGNSPTAHLHYQTQEDPELNDSSISSTFTDINVLSQNSNGIPVQVKSYISDNRIYPVGVKTDNTFNQEIYNAYERNGGYKNLGIPFNNGGSIYVHNWQGIVIQDLQHPDCPNGICLKPKPATASYHGDDGQTAIIYNQEKYRAYLVRDGFWSVLKILGYEFYLGLLNNLSYYINKIKFSYDSESFDY